MSTMHSPTYSSGSHSLEIDNQPTRQSLSNLHDLYSNETQSLYSVHSTTNGLLHEQSRSQDLYPSPSSSLIGSRSGPPVSRSRSSAPSLGELLSYPAVQELYNDLAEANRRVARVLDSQAHMQQEILRLLGMIQPERGVGYMDSRFL